MYHIYCIYIDRILYIYYMNIYITYHIYNISLKKNELYIIIYIPYVYIYIYIYIIYMFYRVASGTPGWVKAVWHALVS